MVKLLLVISIFLKKFSVQMPRGSQHKAQLRLISRLVVRRKRNYLKMLERKLGLKRMIKLKTENLRGMEKKLNIK